MAALSVNRRRTQPASSFRIPARNERSARWGFSPCGAQKPRRVRVTIEGVWIQVFESRKQSIRYLCRSRLLHNRLSCRVELRYLTKQTFPLIRPTFHHNLGCTHERRFSALKLKVLRYSTHGDRMRFLLTCSSRLPMHRGLKVHSSPRNSLLSPAHAQILTSRTS